MPARSRAVGGTGLGLAIVKHIIQAHDGEVTVHSTPGEGSVFTITLQTPEHVVQRARQTARPNSEAVLSLHDALQKPGLMWRRHKIAPGLLLGTISYDVSALHHSFLIFSNTALTQC